ncbi:phage holin [Bacillus sp. CRN 9]|nr:phage holin [Bacillus sp. CRN 9]
MINWKIRLKNPVFCLQVLFSFLIPIMGYYGLTMQEMTTWESLIALIAEAISNPYILFISILSVANAINDPTTRGLEDSDQAKRYQWPR